MKFGQQSSEVKDTSSEEYLRPFRKGTTVVRFLQEPGQFVHYREHYIGGKSFPCTDNTKRCPGCTHESEDVSKRSRKYAAMVYNVERKQVAPYKLAVGLNNKMEARYDRNDKTILTRDFAVIRTGDGLSTDYDVDQEDKYELDIKALLKTYDGSSIEKILKDTFEAIWGDSSKYEGDDDNQNLATVTNITKEAPAKEDPADIPPGLRTKEEQAEVDKAKDDDVEVSEVELKKMTRSELEGLWKRAKLPIDELDEDWSKNELVAEILKRAS